MRILSRRFRTHPLSYKRQIEQKSDSLSREEISQEEQRFNGSMSQSSYPTSSTPTEDTIITMGAIWKGARKKKKIQN